jgi:hypothetical protein
MTGVLAAEALSAVTVNKTHKSLRTGPLDKPKRAGRK